MKATVHTDFMGRPDNEVTARIVKAGEEIDGDLAQAAVNMGCASEIKVAAKPAAPKAKRK